ncbi:MAG TPA: helix-turn-helix transcriptional regulator [Pseudonocardia sp.]
MGECDPRNFLQPCLLLLLRERSDHGYDLVNRLRVLHAVDGDAGAVYRALRGLEKAGMVRSSWQTSDAGPARRTYQVTPLGVAMLEHQVDVLDQTHRVLHLFRLRYEQLDPDPCERPPDHGANCVVSDGAGPHTTNGNGAVGRRNGHGGSGGAHGGSGSRDVRPPSVPGPRSGR